MDNMLCILGHRVHLELAAPIAAGIGQRWLTNSAPRNVRPITISEGDVGWDEQRAVTRISAVDQLVDVQLSEAGFTLRLQDSRLHAAIDQAEARITLCGDTPAVQTLLWGAIAEIIRMSGLIPLHASGIARNGRCAILMAPSKTGKSTTLVGAVLAGYQPVGEDMIWVDPATLAVYGNDRQLRLWPDSLARFQAQFPQAVRRHTDGKYIVPLDTLPGYPPGHCTLHRLVVLRRDLSQPSAWQPTSQLELVRTLWQACGVPFTPQSQSLAQRGMETLIGKVPFAALSIGNTPLDFDPLLA